MNQKNYTCQSKREYFIKEINNSLDVDRFCTNNADSLFYLGLTMYSKEYSLKSLIYNSFAKSFLDKEIALHPEQLKILKKIEENEAMLLSAPTSFGKTFVIFEYIARKRPKNIVLIVPTLALVEEYNKRIIKNYKDVFNGYRVFLSISKEKKYNFDDNNIFILTHDRIIEGNNYSIIKEIDFLVIDEVYKLEKDEEDDRVLILNLAYYHLAKLSKKYILLAPFIGGVDNLHKLNKTPHFYRTDYSPVINEVKVCNISKKEDRFEMVNKIILSIPNNEKTIIYFPTIPDIVKYINLSEVFSFSSDFSITRFIAWLKKEVHEKWYLVRAMEKGFLVYNGQLPIGIRMYQLYLYEKGFSRLICNSALLEGVNTSAKNIVIGRPSRDGKNNFDAFDFFNLVGRSGRLFKHYLGCAYYVKAPENIVYKKNDAIKNIEFEITDTSEDMDIHRDEYEGNINYLKLLKELKIDHNYFKESIGNKFRLKSIIFLFENYRKNKDNLLSEINNLLLNDQLSRLNLIKIFYKIIEGKEGKLIPNIINQCIHKRRYGLNTIIRNLEKIFKEMDIDYLISSVIRIKMSYLEHSFYSKLLIILFFMECDGIEKEKIDLVDSRIKKNIDYIYFTDSDAKKMLKDLGIYEKDIDKIIKIIGDDFSDAFELKERIKKNKGKMKGISFISKFIINNL
ncbi:MAG: DEAD/DEAH box helicase [Bacilli bacterium]|nr:DEAD/DEAH box helicase [Bacilli bacterium]